MNKARHMSLMLILGTMLVASGCGTEADFSQDEIIDSTGDELTAPDDFDKKFVKDILVTCTKKIVANGPKICKLLVARKTARKWDRYYNNKIWPLANQNKKEELLDATRKFSFHSKGKDTKYERALVNVFLSLSEAERDSLFKKLMKKGRLGKRNWFKKKSKCPVLFKCGSRFANGAKIAPMDLRNCALELGSIARFSAGGSL